MEQKELKSIIRKSLQSVLKVENNINTLSNKIYEISEGDENKCKNIVYQTITDINNGKKLQTILNELKKKDVLWKHPFLTDIIAEEVEQDNFIIQPFEIVEGITQCNKCGSKRVFSFTKQTRGGDESSTTFNECLNCRSKWSYSG